MLAKALEKLFHTLLSQRIMLFATAVEYLYDCKTARYEGFYYW